MNTKITTILTLSDFNLQFAQLNDDRFFEKIPSEDYRRLIYESQKCGKLVAEDVINKFPTATLDEIVSKLGIELVFSEMTVDKNFTSVGYFESPNKIVVNSTLKEKDYFFEEIGLSWFNYDFWKEIVIAHELFHFFQEKNTNTFIDQYKISLWHLGPYQNKTKLLSLGEIAAMSFAKKLLALDFYPGFLELLIIYPYFPDEVGRKLDEILSRDRNKMIEQLFND
ncbi:hypothetical protein [Enterococcus dongliensis]|uniref:hypothetical protein n=1 Tax=Enterococcus dongliensis TaxID=2559925 RepID=UPI00288FB76D|nr:hypothetical protein [Enterococcus dongliensis]MDT2612918.1 hypothetical protein [Enterococcus dongliensis]